MDKNLFRKKSIERIASPEQLNDYIKVCNPPLWVLLSAIILLLLGAVVWSIFGRMETKLDTVAIADNSKLTLYVKIGDIDSVIDKTLTVNETEYRISKDVLSIEPISVDEDVSEYVLYLGELSVGEWVYTITFDTELADGVYDVQIVTESVPPLSFVIN